MLYFAGGIGMLALKEYFVNIHYRDNFYKFDIQRRNEYLESISEKSHKK